MNIVRIVISSVIEGAIKRFFGSGRTGETFRSREYFQHYGFTSRPKAGAEGLAIVQGNVIYLVASDDRRYRIRLQEGEVALYTDEGDYIRFQRGRTLTVHTGGRLQVEAAQAVLVTAPEVTIHSSQINLSGSRSGLRRLIDERIIALIDAHVHPGVQTGTGQTAPPSTPIMVTACATDAVRGA